jgi:hypothetical protein
MQAILYGPNGLPLTPQTPVIVDPSFGAIRESIRPLEYSYPNALLGHYRVVATTSAIQPSANANMAALRWAPSTLTQAMFVLLRLRVSFAVAAAGLTPAVQRIDPIVGLIARQYTARDATNATAVTISGHNCKMRTSMGTTLVANIDVASAAAGLSGGTKTVDGNAFGHVDLSEPGAVGGAAPLGFGILTQDLYKWDTLGAHPVVLAANEGILVQWGTTAYTTTTATGLVTVEFEWAEVLAF